MVLVWFAYSVCWVVSAAAAISDILAGAPVGDNSVTAATYETRVACPDGSDGDPMGELHCGGLLYIGIVLTGGAAACSGVNGVAAAVSTTGVGSKSHGILSDGGIIDVVGAAYGTSGGRVRVFHS